MDFEQEYLKSLNQKCYGSTADSLMHSAGFIFGLFELFLTIGIALILYIVAKNEFQIAVISVLIMIYAKLTSLNSTLESDSVSRQKWFTFLLFTINNNFPKSGESQEPELKFPSSFKKVSELIDKTLDMQGQTKRFFINPMLSIILYSIGIFNIIKVVLSIV